ncbi:hypothetical protein MKX03_025110, partial [Papaver bracteatum]
NQGATQEMASNSSCSSKEEEEDESIQLKGLICIIFSWTLKDVQRIPETFSSEEHYLESFRCPLLAETHTELFSSINNIHQSPTCKITSVHKHKDFEIPDFLVYDIMFEASKDTGNKNEIYKPHPSDVITFTHVRPVRFGSLERSYVPAFVLHVAVEKEKDNNRTYLVQILASKPINEKTCMPTYAVFLINLTTNRRIWDALHDGNLNIVKEVLHEYQGGGNCGSCSQEVKCVPGKRLSKDLRSFNLNESQLHAVRSSIRRSACNHRNSVQLIWGPPGTGKTKTVSALLWAMLKMKCRTLTCSPTNIGVVEVSARLMSIVRPTLQRGFYGLGDIVLFGNKDRMKIDDRCNLLDIFLDDRVEKVAKCLSYRTGWGSQLEAMILLLRDSSQQYSLYKDWRESNVEKKDSSAPVNVWEGLEDERSGVALTIKQFIKKRFSLIEKALISCVECFCAHLPTAYVTAKLIEKMYRVLDLLEDVGIFLHTSTYTGEQLTEFLSDSETTVSEKASDTSTYLLSRTKHECLEVLGSLKNSVPAKRASSVKNICLGNARLVFCTASSSAKLSKIGGFKILVIDEAAQLKECESLIPLQLPGLRHAILSGDERQLPSMVQSQITEKANFGRSLFERMVSLGHKKHLLSVQYRMHPSISLFPNSEFYGKRLADAPNVKQNGYKRSLLDGDMYGPYSFINVPYGKEEFNDGHSRKNMLEVAVIDEIVQNLYKASVTNSQKVSVGVISPYKAQVSALIKKFGYKYEQQSNFSVSVRSVDGFQGGEEDIILISTVRTFGCGSVGFLSNRQRTNVAITRARYCLWIVGDGQALINSYSVWRKLLLNAKARGCYYNATEDYRLSKAIANALAELNQLDDLINMNSLLLKGAWWKVIFGDGFWKSLRIVKNVETKKELVTLLMSISSGWRCHPEKPMKPENMTSYSSQLLEKSRITGNLYLLWTVDTIKENSRYIQVLKFLDILSLTEIPKFVEQLDAQFKTSTVDEMNRRKFKRLEGYVLINLYHLLLHLSHNYLTICCSNRSM